MDFSLLPDAVFLKILEYLPFKDRVRVGGINKAFRRIAQLATSRTTSLDLTEDDHFQNLDADQLAVILDLCSPKLKRIKFPQREVVLGVPPLPFSKDRRVWDEQAAIFGNKWQHLAMTFASFEYPRLIHMDLGNAPVQSSVFQQLIRNNHNLESLIFLEQFVAFPNVVLDNLKQLHLDGVNDAGLHSLIGRCPNLNELCVATDNVSDNVFNLFFASIPHVHHLDLRLVNETEYDDNGEHLVDNECLDELDNLWKLPLISLTLRFSEAGLPEDFVLEKVAESFPQLQTFRMYPNMTVASSEGVAALAALKEIEILELDLSEGRMQFEGHLHEYYDQGIRQLATCKQLRKLAVWTEVTGGTLIALLRGCPKLEHIILRGIDEVDSPEQAVVIFERLYGIVNRDIVIEINCGTYGKESFDSIWQTERVKNAIQNLQDNVGLKVKIYWTE